MRAMGRFTLGFLLASVLFCPASPFRIYRQKRKHRVRTDNVRSGPSEESKGWEDSCNWWPDQKVYDHLSDYEVMGEGSYGKVVAFKTTLPESPNVRLAFKRLDSISEGDSVLRKKCTVPDFYYGNVLDHAYVVKSYGVHRIQDDWNVVVMMEAAYSTISKVFEQAKQHIVQKTIARWILQMLVAVHYIHWAGFVHGDLKPEQFMLDTKLEDLERKAGQANIKLGDFGFMCEADTTGWCTSSDGGLRGTPIYMDPFMTSVRESSKDADMWAMGIIIYWLTNGATFPNFLERARQQFRLRPLRFAEMVEEIGKHFKTENKSWIETEGKSEIDQLIAGCFKPNRIKAKDAVELAKKYALTLRVPKEDITKIMNTKEWVDNEFRETMPFSEVEQNNKVSSTPPDIEGYVQECKAMSTLFPQEGNTAIRKQRTSHLDNVIRFFKGDSQEAKVTSYLKSSTYPHRRYEIVVKSRTNEVTIQVQKKRGKGFVSKTDAGELRLLETAQWNGYWEATLRYTSRAWAPGTGKKKEFGLSVRVCLTKIPKTILVIEVPGEDAGEKPNDLWRGLVTKETPFQLV